MECAYLFDEDGSQMYCTVCSAGNQVFMCDTPNCSKVFCSNCIEKLCGPEERMRVIMHLLFVCLLKICCLFIHLKAVFKLFVFIEGARGN